ncbi:hypothetical protein [uncultured Acetobacterium sp.]|uniref:hypothetical protein n=1 Tax=uncultured Acetobacterium sp. TaxID=217139 RepID=UPI0025D28A27|nr:hypothetical protein [uncultured Acetobacterium sp.]
MEFKTIKNISEINDENTIYLKYIYFDDFGYCTSYKAYYYKDFTEHLLGHLKIGYKNLSNAVKPGLSSNGFQSYSVEELLPQNSFSELDDNFFSLGEDISYYKTITNLFNHDSDDYFKKIKDLAYDLDTFQILYDSNEPALINSLLRSIHYPTIEQFHRIINGESELTNYNFSFRYKDQNIKLNIDPDSLPPTNIHVLIGRNGVGKTWLLLQIVHSILKTMNYDLSSYKSNKYELSEDFTSSVTSNTFAGVIAVSFSAFDDGFSSISFEEYEGNNKKNYINLERDQKNDDFNKKFKYIGLSHKAPGYYGVAEPPNLLK